MNTAGNRTLTALAILIALVAIIGAADAGLQEAGIVAEQSPSSQIAAASCPPSVGVTVNNGICSNPPKTNGLQCGVGGLPNGQVIIATCLGYCCQAITVTGGGDAAKMGGMGGTLGQLASQFLQQLLQQLMGGGEGEGGGDSTPAFSDFPNSTEGEDGILEIGEVSGEPAGPLGDRTNLVFTDGDGTTGSTRNGGILSTSGSVGTTTHSLSGGLSSDTQTGANTQAQGETPSGDTTTVSNTSGAASTQTPQDSVVTTYESTGTPADNAARGTPSGTVHTVAQPDARFDEWDQFDRELYGATRPDGNVVSSGGLSLAELEYQGLAELARQGTGQNAQEGAPRLSYESLTPAEIRSLRDYNNSSVAVSGDLNPYGGNPLSSDRYGAEHGGEEAPGFWKKVALFFSSLFGL